MYYRTQEKDFLIKVHTFTTINTVQYPYNFLLYMYQPLYKKNKRNWRKFHVWFMITDYKKKSSLKKCTHSPNINSVQLPYNFLLYTCTHLYIRRIKEPSFIMHVWLNYITEKKGLDLTI